jgi:hypothetical protein
MLFQNIQDYAGRTRVEVHVTEDMRLLGRDALLDSLGLVIVLAGFEADINDTFGTEIILADERAMSLEHSPFRSVSSLVDYASALLEANR